VKNVTCLFTSLRVARGTAVHQIYIYVYIHVFYKNLAYFLQGVSIVTMIVFCLRECVVVVLLVLFFSSRVVLLAARASFGFIFLRRFARRGFFVAKAAA
jgi:hypothetical protein